MVATTSAAPVSVWKPVPNFILAVQSAEQRSPRQPVDDADSESSHIKKRSLRKKPVITGIWPCKINGCNKQFAREADLKRHQRTTKMHSMPSFSCPQCDANFTRTDALRRHQKSRHNGIVIDLVEQNKEGDENADGRSRSGTPSLKGKEKEANLPVPTHQGAPTHTGPSSYYRSHTVTITPHVSLPPSQNKVTNLPTSSIIAPPWPDYPTSWQNGALPPNMGPMGYIPHNMYYPSPHYRPHTNEYPADQTPTYLPPLLPRPHPQMHQRLLNGVMPSASTSCNSSSLHSGSLPVSELQSTSISATASAPTMSSNHNGPIIDPSLDESQELTQAEVVAAVQAVLMQAESEEAAKRQRQQSAAIISSERNSDFETTDRDRLSSPSSINETGHTLGTDDGLNELYGYGGSSSLRRPEPMEHILTEDGEPMLNPAELLTQESLASPPPS